MENNNLLKNTQSFNLQLHGPQLARLSTVLQAEKTDNICISHRTHASTELRIKQVAATCDCAGSVGLPFLSLSLSRRPSCFLVVVVFFPFFVPCLADPFSTAIPATANSATPSAPSPTPPAPNHIIFSLKKNSDFLNAIQSNTLKNKNMWALQRVCLCVFFYEICEVGGL
jgi:hypothetical protein